MYNVYCTCKVIYTNRSGIFPKMLPSIYVGESFIYSRYLPRFTSKEIHHWIPFNSRFQPAKIQWNDRTCVTTWYTISVNVWPKVGVWNVKSWVQWWFRSCLCLERRRYPGDFADLCGRFGFRFMKKTSFFGAFALINIDIVPRILGVLEIDGLKKLYCILVLWLFSWDQGVQDYRVESSL